MFKYQASLIVLILFLSCKNASVETNKPEDKLNVEISEIHPIRIEVRTQTLTPHPKIETIAPPDIIKVKQNKEKAGPGIKTPLKIKYVKKVSELPKPEEIQPKIVARRAERAETKPALPFKTREKNPYNLKFWDIQEGLVDGRGRVVAQTADGLIWLLTESGPVSFDGITFAHHRPWRDDSKNGLFVYLQDSAGTLWYGNDFGAGKYDGRYYYTLRLDSLHPRLTYPMCCDREGNIWYSVSRQGVVKYDGKKFYFYTEKNGLAFNDIRCVFQDSKGNMWFGGSNGSITKYDGSNYTHIDYYDSTLSFHDIINITEDHKGNLWFGLFNRGAAKFDGKDFYRFDRAQGLWGMTSTTIKVGKDDKVYFSMDDGNAGLNIYDGTYFYHVSPEEGLNESNLSHLILDESENIWMSGGVGGLMLYDKNPFRHFTSAEGLKSNLTHCIQNAKNGDLLFSTASGYIRYDHENFYIWEDKQKLRLSIRSLCEDSKGDIWLGADWKGLQKLEGNKLIIYTEELPNTWISALLPMDNGDVFVGTNWGPTFFKDGKFVRFEDDSMITKLNTTALYKDKKGKLWIGAGGAGILTWDGNEFFKMNKAAGFQGRVVTGFAEDTYGNMWITTSDNGLFRYDGKKTYRYTREHGLSGNNLVSCIMASNGDMWIGSQTGLISVSKKSLENVSKGMLPEFVNYGPIEGFTGNTCRRLALAEDKFGKIWCGTYKMLTQYDKSMDQPDTLRPKMIWKNLELAGKDANWQFKDSLLKESTFAGVEYDSATAWNFMPIHLSLPYDKNHLTFQFAGIDFKSYGKIKYSYQLEGLESRWSLWSTDANADYKFVPPGNYTFKVKSRNKDGVESETITYAFLVRPPWWKTKVAYAGYGLALIGIIFGYGRIRNQQLIERQKELEQVVDERTKDIADQKKTIEEKQKEIVDSINYAKRIQFTLLAHEKVLKKHFVDHFILFQPKDIVSGDFYWATKAMFSAEAKNNKELFYLAVCDSTGHGVPGAFMSLLNISFLNEAINEKHIHEPNAILNYVRERLVTSVSREGAKDGMDGILLCFESDNEHTNYKITYAAGNNAPVLFSNGELTEQPFNKMPIGKGEKNEMFQLYEVNAKKGDVLYLYTDGFADQFGGPKGKKFKYKQLNELLLNNATGSMDEQKKILSKALNDWKGDFEQVDDICLIGIKI
jgi:ligand-binding sensor domain-containing protein/serine phosphatase RsbU (regulator of sigma subunit)